MDDVVDWRDRDGWLSGDPTCLSFVVELVGVGQDRLAERTGSPSEERGDWAEKYNRVDAAERETGAGKTRGRGVERW